MFILLRRNKIEHLMHRLIIVSLFVVIELNIKHYSHSINSCTDCISK